MRNEGIRYGGVPKFEFGTPPPPMFGSPIPAEINSVLVPLESVGYGARVAGGVKVGSSTSQGFAIRKGCGAAVPYVFDTFSVWKWFLSAFSTVG